ncbi:GDP-mannose 4,6-dehydratase [Fulvivirga ulvae]|uniref:NAD-dependent epimerase/dehydratase family protein n=1 Tax=Fulvivirga ulvae TaxID=2904245 RepID=UPI001F2D9274|nr:GDP-mannose 4,6-dehydratase [Fulvivirga ulvae]UII31039.1 GDP-mannose 4,6-dehydratase [Fulvivirga ulvae]
MTNLNGSTVMVAGGAGFVGSAIVRELLDLNVKVVCFDNYLHGVPTNVNQLNGDLTIVHGDASNTHSLMECLLSCNVDYIINCIGDTFVPTAYEMPGRFFDINLGVCLNILKAADICKIKRVLYISSTEVYGITDVPLIDESVALDPVNTYAVSKLAADRLCYTFHLEHQTPVVTARIFNCYGPRETEPYIVPEIIYQLNKGNTLKLGNIKAERDFTYVHDTAKALIAVLASDIPNGEVVNVGSNVSYSVEWLAYKIAEIMEVDGLKLTIDQDRIRRLDIDRFRCDNTKLKQYTNWSPTVDIEDGLRKTVDWFRANSCTWSWESFVEGARIYR